MTESSQGAEDEQSCGGTGEEAFEGMTCAWSADCEVATSEHVGPGLPPILRVPWTATSRPRRAWAMRVEADGTIDMARSCELPIPMEHAPMENEEELYVIRDILLDGADFATCPGATHFTAAASTQEALLLPRPCPAPNGSPPNGCPAAGLDDETRERWARDAYEEATQAYQLGEYEVALAGFIGLRALMPNSVPVLHNLASVTARLPHISCSLTESVHRRATAIDPNSELPLASSCYDVPPLLGCFGPLRPLPQHEYCLSRP